MSCEKITECALSFLVFGHFKLLPGEKKMLGRTQLRQDKFDGLEVRCTVKSHVEYECSV